ncbi:hypothetical protein BGW38_009758 [Lunasporangiospora selenospora]|uniref:Uncharacterized protein n=1 Tax=Lunasporangiospora selenospora TaxID=979761 RepID=A0A9P6KG05_9FUNG|nr:hypothetical protein BGW38_009758 [Lunasporangiospora selenospora]
MLVAGFVAVSAQMQQGPAGSATPPSPACMQCLIDAVKTLPQCSKLDFASALSSPTPPTTPEFAACLCSSMDGAWIDRCAGQAQCGPAVSVFKYAESMKTSGLTCGPTPSFAPRQ